MIEFYDRWSGFIPVVGGIYALLMVYRKIRVKEEHREKFELWHRKFGLLLKILSPIIIIYGCWELISKNLPHILGK